MDRRHAARCSSRFAAACAARAVHRESKRKVVYTDFEDQIGEEADVEFGGLRRPETSNGSAARHGRSCRTQGRRCHREDPPQLADHPRRPRRAPARAHRQRRRQRRDVERARRRPEASACSSAAWSVSTVLLPRRRSPSSSTTSVHSEPDRVREPRHRRAQRERHRRAPALLRVAVHRRQPAGPDALFESGDVDRSSSRRRGPSPR